jgi:aspartokinase
LLANVLQIFAQEDLEIDLMSKGIDSLSLTLKTPSFKAKQVELMNALYALAFEKIQL